MSFDGQIEEHERICDCLTALSSLVTGPDRNADAASFLVSVIVADWKENSARQEDGLFQHELSKLGQPIGDRADQCCNETTTLSGAWASHQNHWTPAHIEADWTSFCIQSQLLIAKSWLVQLQQTGLIAALVIHQSTPAIAPVNRIAS